MAENSNIEWTTHTFNPWRGCTKVSEGCKHCYADTLSKRNPGTLGVWGPNGTRVVAAEAQWKEPVKWNKSAACDCHARHDLGEQHLATCPQANRPRVFCASLADMFEDWTGPMKASFNASVSEHEICVCHDCGKWMSYTSQACSDGCRSERLPRKLTMADVRQRLFNLIDATPNLDWLLLTKRPENIARMMPPRPTCQPVYGSCKRPPQHDGQHSQQPQPPRPNLWLGTSVENQKAADERIPQLLRVPAAVRFLSCEPLLGPVDLLLDGECSDWQCGQCGSLNVDTEVAVGEDDVSTYHCRSCGYTGTGEDADWKSQIHWVIAGGESGPGARPAHPDWFRGLRDQCQAAGVPFFFKQWGEWSPDSPVLSSDRMVKARPSGHVLSQCSMTIPGTISLGRVGKKAAGRTLDGRTWDEFPTVKGGVA